MPAGLERTPVLRQGPGFAKNNNNNNKKNPAQNRASLKAQAPGINCKAHCLFPSLSLPLKKGEKEFKIGKDALHH